MKKYVGILIAAIMAFTFCAVGCDTDCSSTSKSPSGGNGGGGNSVTVTDFSIDVTSDVLYLRVGDARTVSVSFDTANANMEDVTFDVAGDPGILDCTTDSDNLSAVLTALVTGEVSVTVALVSNPEVKKTFKVIVLPENSVLPEPAQATTLEVTMDVSCDEATFNEIKYAYFSFDRGGYESKKEDDAIIWRTIKIKNNEITFDKNNTKLSFDIVFTGDDEDYVTDGVRIFFQIQLKNSDDKTLFNLSDIYQEAMPYEKNYKYAVSVFSDGVYGSAEVEIEK